MNLGEFLNLDLAFNYEDTDSFQNEISELYSYGEETEFFANRNAFEESMEDCGLPLVWKHMVPEQQSRAINFLMTTLEVSCRTTRLKSCRALAYLIQGNFGECLTIEEQAANSQENVFSLYEQGIFHAFVQQLLIEANLNSVTPFQSQSSTSSSQLFNDSSDLRMILSVLYTITETLYHSKDSTNIKVVDMRQQFILELQSPIGDELLTVTLFQMLNNFCGGLTPHYPVRKITLLLWKIILITLGGTQTLKELKENGRRMVNLEPPPDDTLEVTKNMRSCSPPLMPDGQARPRTTLSSSGNFVANTNNKRKIYLVTKQPAFDDAVFAYAKECLMNTLAELDRQDAEGENQNDCEFYNALNDSTDMAQQVADKGEEKSIESYEPMNEVLLSELHPDQSSEDSGITPDSIMSEKSTQDSHNEVDTTRMLRDMIKDIDVPPIDSKILDTVHPPPSSSLKVFANESRMAASPSDVASNVYRGLPWAQKVRKADLSQHISNIRQKFLGYTLPNDIDTTAGLPNPIIEGINVLKRHMYITLAEVQLEREEAIEKYPLTHREIDPNFREAPAERLYSALLPRLPQYMIALLKILLAASTGSKNKSERTESINIMSEIGSDIDGQSISQSLKMNTDANRHKEVIIKAVSAILILLLKHFRVNHIYQFEYVSQQLMFANCIPLILKFLSQDIYSYIVTSKSDITTFEFPTCVIGKQPEMTTEQMNQAIELSSLRSYSWRNMFSCINLVRILNKLTKWKHSRIMMLVVFKSAPTLAKALNVRHSMLQLYILKLLKVQLKFLGRPWKKTNMKLISAIYQKVRHRLTDDWAYSNDNEARPWDFQAEEFTLQADINKFHQRRYYNLLAPNSKYQRSSLVFNQADKFGGFEDCIDEDYDFGPEDANFGRISADFERNYERWLESEVFQRYVDWDKLLVD